jgi:glycosyltransferase involved in cell wall biosynthesis
MRIGIDCRTILAPGGGEGAGVGHYTYYLVKHLLRVDGENEYVLFCDPASVGRVQRDCIAGRPRTEARIIPFFSIKKRLPFVYSHMFVSNVFARQNLDLLHAPAGTLPLFYRRPSVITVHDLSIYAHPEWFPGELPGSQTFSTRITVPRSVEAARRIIAVSESTKQDIERVFGVSAERIDVVPEGSEEVAAGGDAEDRLAKYHLRPGDYVFFVGTLEPRKNLPTAIRAFVRAASREWLPKSTVFAIAGAHGWKYEGILEAIAVANERLGSERVRLLGYLSQRDKVAVMGEARAFLFPSHYEGFGLPLVEAMRLGTPVITSNVSSMPEVCGDAAILVEPEDEERMAVALRDIFGDSALAAAMRAKGRERGELFTWERAARETLEVYRQAAAGGETGQG